MSTFDDSFDAYCEDCGVHLYRHGDECGYELGDHAAGYFEEPRWEPPMAWVPERPVSDVVLPDDGRYL